MSGLCDESICCLVVLFGGVHAYDYAALIVPTCLVFENCNERVGES
jgi:hypothetical protein